MATGNITRIVRDRGFGFIQPDGGTEEVFFHSSVVEQPTFDELKEGQKVQFETEPDPRQPSRSRAAHVQVVG
ncbi:MAG: cold shock domain-containing protein [Dehalococcoidia bacterium]|nr:cold shock domain-containing protein [Dehalococcoidia bacterium]